VVVRSSEDEDIGAVDTDSFVSVSMLHAFLASSLTLCISTVGTLSLFGGMSDAEGVVGLTAVLGLVGADSLGCRAGVYGPGRCGESGVDADTAILRGVDLGTARRRLYTPLRNSAWQFGSIVQ
jgi:hypothetical protein